MKVPQTATEHVVKYPQRSVSVSAAAYSGALGPVVPCVAPGPRRTGCSRQPRISFLPLVTLHSLRWRKETQTDGGGREEQEEDGEHESTGMFG